MKKLFYFNYFGFLGRAKIELRKVEQARTSLLPHTLLAPTIFSSNKNIGASLDLLNRYNGIEKMTVT